MEFSYELRLARRRVFDPVAVADCRGRGAWLRRLQWNGRGYHYRNLVVTLEGHSMTAAIATFVIGVIVGYLGQRSRMCFVGGIRDFLLVRDTYLLRGLIAFGLTAWVAFPLASLVLHSNISPFAQADAVTVVLTIAGGFGVGYFSTLANGCP